MAGSHLAALGVPAALTALLPPNCINWLESALKAGGDIHNVKVRLGCAQRLPRLFQTRADFRALPDASLPVSA
jgi:hypothetical protein